MDAHREVDIFARCYDAQCPEDNRREMAQPPPLTELERDALSELSNIAMARAATVCAKWSNIR
jgi:hypothetical protein